MSAKDNLVYATSQEFAKNFTAETPEAVLYGYAKLLLMDENAVKNIIPEQMLTDLDAARMYMKQTKLDLDLIRSGMPLLASAVIFDAETRKKYDEFAAFLQQCAAGTDSVTILTKTFEAESIPVQELFGIGSTLDAVFSYQEKLLKNKPKEAPKTPETPKQEPAEKKEEKTPKTETKKETGEKKDFMELAGKYRNLSGAIMDVVKGQNQAVLKFVQGCFQGEILQGTDKKNKPKSYFFFFGPPGTGKTLLAQTAAENMNIPYKIFDMSEYSTEYAHEKLMGTPQMFKNSKEGNLVKFVRENPECLLIFDEIEKAHPLVIRLFLQILGSGKLQNDAREEDTDFSNTIIIFTSNVGKELYADKSVNLTTLPERVILDAIQREKNSYGAQVLPNEICSRIASGNMILFNHINIRHLAGMVKSNFENVASSMNELYDCRVTYAPALPLLFIYNRGGEMDARVATNQSANFVKNEIYELTRQLEKRVKQDERIKAIHFDIDWDSLEPELKRLFVNESKTEVLVLAEKEMQSFFDIDPEKYKVHYADSLEKAKELAKLDITAIFIDPFFGKKEMKGNVLSISDYNTDGVAFFHEMCDVQIGLPIYMLETGTAFSDVDRKTFLQEGAADTIIVDTNRVDAFKREFVQIMDELYMERESQAFSSQGWVIDFNTKQDTSPTDGRIDILFYDLKKRMAVDLESRGAILSEAERPTVKFSDVIGAEKAKEELEYFIEYLKNPKRFLMEGGKPPKGVLLYGPPGTGKTMLAKAMAGESDVSFFQTSASEFKNMWVGESEANIRRLFARAKKYAPAIIFIDEIDAIGKKRTGGSSADTTESMLNALLTEMDGFSSDRKKPVFVLAATNYGVGAESDGIAALDEALIRRFDNKIYVDLPNQDERKEYLKRLISKKKNANLSDDVLDNIAERTTGQSLAILQNVLDLAFRNATKEHRGMENNDLLNALEEYLYGEKKESTPEYYRSVAIHETGHAYVSYISGDKPSYLTIEARGNFGGYMQHGNSEDVPSYTRDELLGKIRTSLAGRAAETVFFGKDKANNTGASSDLRQATNYAFHIICSYGMEEDQLISLDRNTIMSSSVAGRYIDMVNKLLNEQMVETIRIIEDGRDTIEKIASELTRKNHLTGEEFAALMEN